MSTIIQRSFASGELSPSLYARVDFFKYQTGLRTCRNFFIMRHGGATNRPGTKFVGEVSDSSKTVRLIPFIFNSSQAYVLEFGDLYMRIIQNGSYLTQSATTITGVTQADPAVVTTSASHGYSNGNEVFIDAVVGMSDLNNRNFKVANVTATTFELQTMESVDFDSTGLTAYSSAGTAEKIYTVTSPYAEADLSTLKFTQSADVLTVVHPTYPPKEISRVAALNWTIASVTYIPVIATPTSAGAAGSAGTETYRYKLTSIAEETYEESLPTAVFSAINVVAPTAGAPLTITWSTVADGVEYNVYKEINGVFGLIGIAGPLVGTPANGRFYDPGIDPDTSITPPNARDPFGSTDNYPSTVAYFQQRLIFANTNSDLEKVWMSRTGLFSNYTISYPLRADDAITIVLAGKQVNEIKHMIDIDKLVLFTSAGEWTLEGSGEGVITPTTLNLRQQSYNGASNLAPIIIDKSALYVQARGSIVRDLGYDFSVDGYKGNDLTIFSSHLFDNYTLVDWAFQQVPHSILWAVREDGVLLALTYVKEQSLVAWSRHDFDGGTVENVCVVPEGTEDVLYVTVKRTVNGLTKRYVERMSTRNIVNIEDSTFVDSHYTYDGRNTTATTMTLSGGTTWAYTETLTLTASTSFFSAGMVGKFINMRDSAGLIIRAEITAYTSTTVVDIKPNRTVPATLQSVAVTDWDSAIETVTGLWHLEGKDISVFADGFVAANPKNEAYTVVTVTDGVAILDKAYGLIHLGLPYISDIETLDIDSSQSETLADKNKITKGVTIFVEDSRGIFVGAKPPSDDSVDPLEGLIEMKIRNDEDYDDPVALKTGTVDVNITSEWNSNGRVFVRQVDPVPLSVLAVAAAGDYPFRKA